MPSPPSLPAALRARAAAAPEEPWLFRAEGWDWRWHSWKELAGWMESRAADLSSHPAGSRVSFLYRADPESVILDLAIQAAGLVSAPESAREAGSLWIEPPGERVNAGGAVVRIGGEAVEWTAAELVAAGERLREEIRSPEGRREVVVLGGPLEDPAERAMLSWATLAGAAVVLEPNPSLRPATAAWVRPTVFHGSPEEIAGLRTRVRKARKGRLPFRRLRVVLAKGEMGEEDAAFWEGVGVRVGRVPFPERPGPATSSPNPFS